MKTIFRFLIMFALLFVTKTEILAQDTRWEAPEYANSLMNPLVGNIKATNEGKEIYNQMCVLCHGLKGQGNGEAGLLLETQPADFLVLKVKEQTDGAIFWKITTGNPPMASYLELLSDNQRWKLVNYIRELGKN